MAAATSSTAQNDTDNAPFPPWLANHLNIEWNSDDVDALLSSIEASQCPKSPTLPHLPAELLILILEYIPVAHVLDWRLVCRGFRDAIDGPILYHHLQRTRLVGYLGPRASPNIRDLSDNEYEQLHLVPARFQSIAKARAISQLQQQPSPIWCNTHAVFKIRYAWWAAHKCHQSRPDFPSRSSMLSQVTLCRTDQGYGTLIWAIRLDTAVLDLDFPLEPNRHNFDVDVDTKTWTVRVEWKPMLFRFLRTERALRLLMDKKHNSTFTFSHAEDCLRAMRRQRLHAALDPDSKIDRHIKWSLRLLRPLWGIGGHGDPSTLDPVEADAVRVLLLLRREAALSDRQIKHLWHLASDYKAMVRTMDKLSRSIKDLKQQLIMPGHASILELEVRSHDKIPANPIAWSDELRANIETRVQRWRAQQNLIELMQTLMITSQEALAVPEDAFDMMDSDF
ncbi:hypothetical protein BU25DRAFT_445036 [Macroventuria anomochaeta]|uniref:Uncharacterized protein n=1 Tax=Macroventuria anomochaeta TaxID=301207 RepID=A0ACB6SIB4_9PLEO|nr:uncharacterized protein BU25DRAFT_445036 [Macroventuria anomochaeta]KAF2633098.1 hypothetical protein BU25DRAFT_445036 [Macroventuria anomochaeta]